MPASMTSVSLDVQGFADVEKALDNLSKSAGKGVLRRSLKKAAQPTADLAASLAPRKTGNLAKSIIVGTKLDGRQAKIHKKMFKDDKSAVTIFVGPSYLLGANGRHGHLVEFGTAPHINGGQFAGSQHPGTAAQPFMRPAWEQDKMAMLERLKSELWSELEKSIKRADAKAARAAMG